ncbi:MAG TPA: hypothetical protein VMW19_05185 [Myxococcota bacterium]|nr:hypothetical protein [Myxococcota bacterium]
MSRSIPILVALLGGLVLSAAVGRADECTIGDVCTGEIGGAPFVTGKVTGASGNLAVEILDENENKLAEDVVGGDGKFNVDAPLNSRKYWVVITDLDTGEELCRQEFEAKDPLSDARFVAGGPLPIPVPSTQTFTPTSPLTIIDDGAPPVVVPLSGSITVQFHFTGDPLVVQGSVTGLDLTVPSFAIGPLTTGVNTIALKNPSTFSWNPGSQSAVGGISVHASNDLGEANFDGALDGTLDPVSGVWNPMGSGSVCSVSDFASGSIPNGGAWALWSAAALLLATAFVFIRRGRRLGAGGAPNAVSGG